MMFCSVCREEVPGWLHDCYLELDCREHGLQKWEVVRGSSPVEAAITYAELLDKRQGCDPRNRIIDAAFIADEEDFYVYEIRFDGEEYLAIPKFKPDT
jgi:hypothetical protein